MYIDTHCHLTFPDYNNDLVEVLARAKKAGVEKCIVPGVDSLSNKLSVELARSFPGVIFSAVGFHPYEASHNPLVSELDKFMSLYKKQIVAIGECGLDYHLYKGEKAEGKKQVQRILFEEHIRLALKYNLPLTMHCRDAYEDFWNVLDSAPHIPRGVIHCFSGGLQDLRMAIERKLFVGIDGNVTYSKQLSLIVPQIPLESIILETDSPYLTPVPHRGQRNEPGLIPFIAKHLADLIHVPIDLVERQTTINAQGLFML
jgi:TatD DNase family protein